MIHRFLKIGRWKVDFLFADTRYDKEEVLSFLEDMGASFSVIKRTEEIMESGRRNTGFTYTDSKEFRALVVTGPSSSGKEFVNTMVHEIHHLAVAIAAELGVDLEGETPAYLAGDSMRELADVVCRLGCRES